MLDRTDPTVTVSEIGGVRIELVRGGSGQPLLLLHPAIGIRPSDAVIGKLAQSFDVLAPSHPGYGKSDLPRHFATVDDLAYFYLDLLDTLDLRNVVLAGISFGGWIAAEIAIKSTERISHLVLADAVGIRVKERDQRDIVDIFTTRQDELDRLAWHDPGRAALDHTAVSDEDAAVMFRNREATALFAWSPYMHSPKLARRLHRIKVPTLFLWGESDRIAPLDYGRAYAALIPDARFETIKDAGHYPHLENPDLFAQKIVDFAAATPAGAS